MGMCEDSSMDSSPSEEGDGELVVDLNAASTSSGSSVSLEDGLSSDKSTGDDTEGVFSDTDGAGSLSGLSIGGSIESEIDGTFSDNGENVSPAGNERVGQNMDRMEESNSPHDDGSENMSILSLEPSVGTDSPSTVHRDGEFHAEDMKVLLASYENVRVISDDKFFADEYIISESLDTIIVFSCQGKHGILRESIAISDGGNFELRFLLGHKL